MVGKTAYHLCQTAVRISDRFLAGIAQDGKREARPSYQDHSVYFAGLRQLYSGHESASICLL